MVRGGLFASAPIDYNRVALFRFLPPWPKAIFTMAQGISLGMVFALSLLLPIALLHFLRVPSRQDGKSFRLGQTHERASPSNMIFQVGTSRYFSMTYAAPAAFCALWHEAC